MTVLKIWPCKVGDLKMYVFCKTVELVQGGCVTNRATLYS